MEARLCLGEPRARAALEALDAKVEERGEGAAKGQELGHSSRADHRHHVARERRLQRRALVHVVEYDERLGISLDLEDDPQL